MDQKSVKALLLQFSGILGAGIFVLPYVFSQSGLFVSLLFFFFLVAIVSLANLIYIRVILSTRGDHQLSGYAQIHLGPHFRNLILLNIIALSFGALSAYIKLASGFLALVFPFLPSIILPSVFIVPLFLVHFFPNRTTHLLNHFLPLLSLLIIVFLFISSFFFPSYTLPVLNHQVNFSNLGALIFALSGFTVIPEVEEILRGSKNISTRLSLASLGGLYLIVVVYLLFIYAVTRISGGQVSPDAITGLFFSSPFLGKLLAFFGIITLFKSSLNFLLVLKETLYRDIHLSLPASYQISAGMVLATFLFTSASFLQIISLTGSATVFVSLLVICLIFLKIKPKSGSYLPVILVLGTLTFVLITQFL